MSIACAFALNASARRCPGARRGPDRTLTWLTLEAISQMAPTRTRKHENAKTRNNLKVFFFVVSCFRGFVIVRVYETRSTPCVSAFADNLPEMCSQQLAARRRQSTSPSQLITRSAARASSVLACAVVQVRSAADRNHNLWLAAACLKRSTPTVVRPPTQRSNNE